MKNELIRELEKQSFITTETQKISGAWDNIVEPFRYVTVTETNFSLEKFAELIVFECVNAVMDGTKEGDHYAQRIEQHFDNGTGGVLHFGVEE
jgi:hypothetical protein